MNKTIPLIEVKNLTKRFPIRGGLFQKEVASVKAVTNVSFLIEKGETLGLVGESGCGKSTLGRCLLRLIEPTSGEIFFEGREITRLDSLELRRLRRKIQIIFQDPYSALNPRMTVEEIIREPLDIHSLFPTKLEKSNRVLRLLDLCGLRSDSLGRYPHEFSGGQRQRICIARALAVEPEFLVCDEVVSSLDVSIQAQILNLLADLQKELKLTYLFIGHDLSVVRHISDRVAVMYLGGIVELAHTQHLYDSPRHPYSRALISSIPIPDPSARAVRSFLPGDPSSALALPSGCSFHPRCTNLKDKCRSHFPELLEQEGAHRAVACHFPIN